MTTSVPRLLWLDDELDSDRSSYVVVWKRWLQQANDKGLIRLSTCNCLSGFAAKLQDAEPPFDLLIFDVMLKREPSRHFGPVGYEDEKVRRLEAGIQLVGLMRNREFAGPRPDWLARYSDARVVLLSSTPGLDILIGSHVNGDRTGRLHCLVKSLNTDVPGTTRPDAAFERSFWDILREVNPASAGG